MRAELTRDWPDTPARDLSLALINHIAELPPEQAKCFTYRSLANAVNKPILDHDLHAAITILSASPIAALNVEAFFLDVDGVEHELTSEEFSQARQGVFVHPISGETVENFADRIIPYFVPSARFDG